MSTESRLSRSIPTRRRILYFVLLIATAPILIVAAALAADSAPPADNHSPGARSFTSPFGIGGCHVRNRSRGDNETWVPQMREIGLHVFRTPQAGWGAVEPEEGKWGWDELDRQMAYLGEQGFQFGIMLYGNARWNKLDTPGTLPVNNLAGWKKYAAAVVEHVKGKARHFEIWNEPPNGTGRDQTPADYARIVVAAYDAAKAAQPDCFVGLSAKSAHVNYLAQVIEAGARDHFDYIVLHPYEVLNGVAENRGTEAVFMNIVPTVRRMLADKNPAKAGVPIIFTELGSDAAKGADKQAQALVKAYTMGIAQGVACIQWFEGRDGDSGPMGLIDARGTPRPSYTALREMIRHFGDRPEYLGWVLVNNRHYGFAFRGRDGTTLLSTWSRPGRPDVVKFDRPTRIANPVTGNVVEAVSYELTYSPILILDVPQAWLSQAEANRMNPLPWGGDYSNAREVSIEWGESTKERGLHTLSGADVAAAVVAYGGSARAGDVPGGNMFTVDPNFLSYTTEPIEITAVVRRNPADDNAGFKLVYESTQGFKTAGGWYTVPDNKKWHTVTWKIDDPRFVNYWGYNFNLESDGNQFNKYLIKSVTVRKRGR